MKVGDRVRIITKKYEGNGYAPQFGICGIITRSDSLDGRHLLHLIKRNDGRVNPVWYPESDLEYEHESEIMTPDFSLDEIALGEEIISQMD